MVSIRQFPQLQPLHIALWTHIYRKNKEDLKNKDDLIDKEDLKNIQSTKIASLHEEKAVWRQACMKTNCTKPDYTRRWTYSALRYFFILILIGFKYISMSRFKCLLDKLLTQYFRTSSGSIFKMTRAISKEYSVNLVLWSIRIDTATFWTLSVRPILS